MRSLSDERGDSPDEREEPCSLSALCRFERTLFIHQMFVESQILIYVLELESCVNNKAVFFVSWNIFWASNLFWVFKRKLEIQIVIPIKQLILKRRKKCWFKVNTISWEARQVHGHCELAALLENKNCQCKVYKWGEKTIKHSYYLRHWFQEQKNDGWIFSPTRASSWWALNLGWREGTQAGEGSEAQDQAWDSLLFSQQQKSTHASFRITKNDQHYIFLDIGFYKKKKPRKRANCWPGL